jgi:hypothetical protein
VLEGVRRDGARVALEACIVCQVRDGRITRLDEYFDSAAVAKFVGQTRAELDAPLRPGGDEVDRGFAVRLRDKGA